MPDVRAQAFQDLWLQGHASESSASVEPGAGWFQRQRRPVGEGQLLKNQPMEENVLWGTCESDPGASRDMEHAKNMHFIAAFTQEEIHHPLWGSVIEIQELRIDVRGGHTYDCADALTA